MTHRTPFDPVPSELDFPRYERAILEFWKERQIFEKSVARRSPQAQNFVFYEGPPTANGVPHNGHVLTRVVKDLFPRYHAMLGARVLRKGGWDTHGLPVEVEVEKELRIHGKAAIEAYGIEAFVERCIESVFRYTSEWERLTERIGFWVSLDDAYVTYHTSYVESVWWALSELFKKGLLYQGHKVVWWWAQGGTALSSAEVGLGYKTVDDPSVYVAFPLLDTPERALVVWTTTPWTLPSNAYAAVKPGSDYDIVRIGKATGAGETKAGKAPGGAGRGGAKFGVSELIVASALRRELAEKICHELSVVETVKGAALVGLRYEPPFDFYSRTLLDAEVRLKDGRREAMWWRVLGEDFVTLSSGTGIVHLAPAFGEDDHNAHRRQLARYEDPEQVELLCAILPDGTFKPEFGRYAGRWVKDADPDILEDLAAAGRLVFKESYRHDYPFCWRADQDPLIQMARPAWFIRTTARLDQAKANNLSVNWLPEHIKTGRFGDFLENNVDWALSRERYWGTPLNVWVCEADAEHKLAPASLGEIEALNPEAFAYFRDAKRAKPTLNEHLIVHKPWIDNVTFACPTCGKVMRRVPEVIDCWFDSGCMPFAQWGFPATEGSKERFDAAFPADFISEAIDQTRGWFYSLLMISTLIFDEETQRRLGLETERRVPHPFKTCIVLGLVSDKEGKKESKSRGNYTPPDIILDKVRMEFGVLSDAPGVSAKPGEALIAREDLEGMDLSEGASVSAYRADNPDKLQRLVVRAHKKLPRRLVLIADEQKQALGVSAIQSGLQTMPVEVPRAAVTERITLEDDTTPAPGADAFRWFFYAASPPWTNTRHSLSNVRTLQKEFQVKLRNVYVFFTLYANIDGWRPTEPQHRGRPASERALLDRWLLSELNLTVREVRRALDNYMIYDAALRLIDFAESLSNWYVRRSRTRFWGPGLEPDKCDAYATLYEALVTLSKLTAPFLAFMSEEMYRNLVVRAGVSREEEESVHLSAYPEVDARLIDEGLATEMRAVRQIVSLGLSVRTANKLKVRQPLGRADVVFNDSELMKRLELYRELIRDELNVHEVRFMYPGHEQGAVAFRLKANFRTLGPRLGKRVQEVKKALEGGDGSAFYRELTQSGKLALNLASEELLLTPEEVEVVVEAARGFAAETGAVGVVVLHTTLSEALLEEGLLREMMSRIQAMRKELGLEFTDRIELWICGSERIERVAKQGAALIESECLVTTLHVGEPGPDMKDHALGDETLSLAMRKAD